MPSTATDACHALGTRPKPDESLIGFVFRLARRRGMSDAGLLVRQAGGDARNTVAALGDQSVVRALGTLSGTDWKDLLAISFVWRQNGTCAFRGTPLNALLVAGPQSGRRVCPDCLAEDPYHRAAWHLSFC